ncbi:PspC domain-containing protein [Ancylomarina euxinus]|uniref:PspC domain-containing protein n=1 Tax=Ancylomarina euxinus TaxID=2283627 RepID=A0A425XX30_9BACT|nr:PspC domain-containing protein [Ancylomarina euxinus]MCZ4696258.1 PspC domain-containing protein [Ancylomarina euxinus]MUP16633.1 PspC domain-containing protein [Ancylomarina euxinus]RRG19193.1 PspC domain-containing protein [Ancylomarina euxinus]
MRKKLKRSSNKMIAGVCAGIAEYLGLDVTLVRVAYVLLSIFSAGFPGLIVYVILMFVMPDYYEVM